VLQAFDELHLKRNFYAHQHPLRPIISDGVTDSVLFFIDYFGCESVPNDTIYQYLDQGNTVILDVTHSIFNLKRFELIHDNLYLVSSLRKVFPIPDGGILFSAHALSDLPKQYPYHYDCMIDAMALKSLYLASSHACDAEKKHELKDCFLKLYANYEKDKDTRPIILQRAPAVSLYILENIDIRALIKQRTANLKLVYTRIQNDKYFLFDIRDLKSAFCLPMILNSEAAREALKDKLIREGIYPPIHWDLRGVSPKEFSYEHTLSKQILSIPIDQRYNERALLKVVDIINS
jgi:hypothetical protein